MAYSKSALAAMKKEELIDIILEMEGAEPEKRAVKREVRVTSPAGPVHVHKGFVDDGEGPLTIDGLPEDEYGHWAPYYELVVNGKRLEGPDIRNG